MFITTIGMYVNLFLWLKFNDGPFEHVFSFYREKNRRKEWKLAVRLVAGVSIGCMVLYYLLYAILGGKAVPVYYMCFVVLEVYASYLAAVGLGIEEKVGIVLLVFIILVPNVLALIVMICHVKLDIYCGYASVILLVIDILMEHNIRQHWKKGDI